MNNVDRVFPGQTFSKNQLVHGYDYNENGERIFTIIGEDLIYDRIQESNNSTDMDMIKNQLLPAVEADENAVDRYFKAYGDIKNLKVGDEIETTINKSSDVVVPKIKTDGDENSDKDDCQTDQKI